jgi:hypothetical protein
VAILPHRASRISTITGICAIHPAFFSASSPVYLLLFKGSSRFLRLSIASGRIQKKDPLPQS